MIDGMPTGAWRYREPGRGARTAWLRGVQVATAALYGLLAATGALLDPASVLVVGPISAVFGGAAVLGLRRGLAEELPPLPRPLLVAGWAAGLPAAVSGSSALGAWGGLAAALVLAGSAVLFGQWIGSDTPPDARTGAWSAPDSAEVSAGVSAEDRAWDETSMRQVLAAMPTELLLEEWQTTGRGRFRGSASRGLAVVRLRDLLIDELQFRDPDGVTRWLREGPAEPPGRFIRPDAPSTDDQVH